MKISNFTNIAMVPYETCALEAINSRNILAIHQILKADNSRLLKNLNKLVISD